MTIDPQELLFKEKVIPVEFKRGKSKIISFKKRNVGNKNFRVRNADE